MVGSLEEKQLQIGSITSVILICLKSPGVGQTLHSTVVDRGKKMIQKYMQDKLYFIEQSEFQTAQSKY